MSAWRTFVEIVLFDVPEGVDVAQVWIARHLLLLVAPLRQLLAGGGQRARLQVVDELQLAADGRDFRAVRRIRHAHTPHVVRIARSILNTIWGLGYVSVNRVYLTSP